MFIQPGNTESLQDFSRASNGQWFYGILHMGGSHNGSFYLFPSDPGERAAADLPGGRPQPPRGGWQTLSKEDGRGLNTRPPDAGAPDGDGFRGHLRGASRLGLPKAECLGFTVIKLSASSARLIDHSNSMNDRHRQKMTKFDGAASSLATGPQYREAGHRLVAHSPMPNDWKMSLQSALEQNLNLHLTLWDD